MSDTKRSLEGWHPLEDVAKRRGRSTKTIRRWCDRGLRHSKIGATVVIHEDDEVAFLEANARGGNIVQRGRAE
jgi:hypothetical protein